MMFEAWERISIRYRFLLVVFLLLSAAAAVAYMWIWPDAQINKQLGDDAVRFEAEQRELLQVLQGTKEIPELDEEFLERYQRSAAVMVDRIPPKLSALEIVRELNVLANKVKLEKVSLANKENNVQSAAAVRQQYPLLATTSNTQLSSIDVSMSFKGYYWQLVQFLNELKGMRRFLSIQDIALSREVPKAKVRLLLRVYILNEGEEV